MRKRLMLQACYVIGYLASCVVFKAHTHIFWPHYQMCTLCTVTAPGTSDCSAAKWARQINMSHVVTLSHSDTPIANTPVYTHSVQPFRLLYALFPACSTTNKPNGNFGLFRLLCYLFHQNLIHYLIMVLPVKNGNIAFNMYIGLRHLHLVYTSRLHTIFAIPYRPGVFRASLCSLFALNQSS